MKKVFVTLMLLAGFTAIAQKGESRAHHRDAIKDLTPQQIATLKTKKMTLALELTEQQQEEIQKINLENAALRKAKMEERTAKKEEGESKKPTTEERYTMLNERLDRQIAVQDQMKQILTEEQFDQWKKMQHRKGKHHRQHKKHSRK
ncbi:MAG: hypothetical protein AAFZ89_10845 [Bacteroidota bacterium]